MKIYIIDVTGLMDSASTLSPNPLTDNCATYCTLISWKSTLSMKYQVAVVGCGPSETCTAEIFAQEQNTSTILFEKKMTNAKLCGVSLYCE